MGSVMEQVFEAMPLRAVRWQIEVESSDWTEADSKTLAEYVHVLPPTVPLSGGDANVVAPAVSAEAAKDAPTTGVDFETPVWSYAPGEEPNVINQITCRAHEDGYREYLVLEQCKFGSVRIQRGNEGALLPLTKGHLFAVLRTTKDAMVFNPEHLIPLFPLKARYEQSLVYAFLFDVPFLLDVANDPDAPPLPDSEMTLTPLRVKETDPQGWAALQRAIEDFSSSSGASGGTTSSTVRQSLFRDDLWSPLDDEHWADVGDQPTELRIVPARVLVLVSFTPCSEFDDYQPPGPIGGLAGMARLYPHVMVKATLPLDAIESGLSLRRPARTTIRDGKPCGCPEMGETIAPLLVADTNADDQALAPPPPHWEAIFAYYQTDAHWKFGGKKLRIVEPGWTKKRTLLESVQYETRTSKTVTKLPRQGAFDNIHMAPKMHLPEEVVLFGSESLALRHKLSDLEPHGGWADALKDIVMAPICAHDCFHGHWRWGDAEAKHRAVHGWDAVGPYRVPGAPMVPLHHAVDLAIVAANEILVIERALGKFRRQHPAPRGPKRLIKEIPSDTWEIFHHPGYAYAVWAQTFTLKRGRDAVDAYSNGSFYDKDGNRYGADDSWAVFYFFNRYVIELHRTSGKLPDVRERVRPLVPIEKLMETDKLERGQ